jgi:hypothetical protein
MPLTHGAPRYRRAGEGVSMANIMGTIATATAAPPTLRRRIVCRIRLAISNTYRPFAGGDVFSVHLRQAHKPATLDVCGSVERSHPERPACQVARRIRRTSGNCTLPSRSPEVPKSAHLVIRHDTARNNRQHFVNYSATPRAALVACDYDVRLLLGLILRVMWWVIVVPRRGRS